MTIFVEQSNGNLLVTSQGQTIYAFADDQYLVAVFDGADLFEGACTRVGFSSDLQVLEDPREHPIGSYNIAYPYCRTAVRYRMDDPRSDPQIAQLIVAAPIMQTRLYIDGCDQSPIASVTFSLQPPSNNICGASFYPGGSPTDYYLIVDASAISLPSRVNFTVTNKAGVTKSFWIGFRSGRDAPPSQTVLS